MFDYPKKIDIIFDKLVKVDAKPIIIGGFVRDSLLGIGSKDIDIEVYGISSYKKLETILREFGRVNSVGKSFGVCKLTYKNIELDFTLPRVDSKITTGHKGFIAKINPYLDFHTAFLRRDFTINAIGFDVINKKILDPFNGIKDLKNRILRAVNEKTFVDDPLRVLRAIQFSARFNLTIDEKLMRLSKDMIKNNMLDELSKDRIFGEIKKLLLKSNKPSIGFLLLKELGTFKYFIELESIKEDVYSSVLLTIDEMKKLVINNEKANIVLMLASICYTFNSKQVINFIKRVTDEKNILTKVLALIENYSTIDYINSKDIDDTLLYNLATKANIEELLLLNEAIYLSENSHKTYSAGKMIKKRAKRLGILNKKMAPLLKGRDILKFSPRLKPSKEFTIILNRAYKAQTNREFTTYPESLLWLKRELLS